MTMHRRTRCLSRLWGPSTILSVAALVASAAVDPGGAARLIACSGPLLIGWGA